MIFKEELRDRFKIARRIQYFKRVLTCWSGRDGDALSSRIRSQSKLLYPFYFTFLFPNICS